MEPCVEAVIAGIRRSDRSSFGTPLDTESLVNLRCTRGGPGVKINEAHDLDADGDAENA